MKTLRLIESYIRYVTESGEPEAVDVPVESESREIGSNERYIIKILTNALIFNPLKFPDQRETILNDIENIRVSPGNSIASIISRIKSIIALDRSLVIEGSTGQLFIYYTELLERSSLDATEPQQETAPSSIVDDSPTETSDPSLEIDVDLDEIFPLYQDMILNAMSYEPSSRDLIMLRDVVNGIGESDPLSIIDTIQGIMNSRRSEEDIADDLTEI